MLSRRTEQSTQKDKNKNAPTPPWSKDLGEGICYTPTKMEIEEIYKRQSLYVGKSSEVRPDSSDLHK